MRYSDEWVGTALSRVEASTLEGMLTLLECGKFEPTLRKLIDQLREPCLELSKMFENTLAEYREFHPGEPTVDCVNCGERLTGTLCERCDS